jgi:hypothetical protein
VARAPVQERNRPGVQFLTDAGLIDGGQVTPAVIAAWPWGRSRTVNRYAAG